MQGALTHRVTVGIMANGFFMIEDMPWPSIVSGPQSISYLHPCQKGGDDDMALDTEDCGLYTGDTPDGPNAMPLTKRGRRL